MQQRTEQDEQHDVGWHRAAFMEGGRKGIAGVADEITNTLVGGSRVSLDRHGGFAYFRRRDTSPQREAYYLEG